MRSIEHGPTVNGAYPYFLVAATSHGLFLKGSCYECLQATHEAVMLAVLPSWMIGMVLPDHVDHADEGTYRLMTATTIRADVLRPARQGIAPERC